MLQSDIPSELEMKMLDRLSNNGLSENPCEVVKFNDEPKIPTYVCLPNKHAQTTYLCNGAYGLGSALNPTPAKIKSIAEFLERLAIFNPQRKLFKKSKYIERSCTNPFLFARYSNIKAELENSTFLWSHAISYPDKKKIFVPAQSIYISDMFKYETKLASEYITTGEECRPPHEVNHRERQETLPLWWLLIGFHARFHKHPASLADATTGVLLPLRGHLPGGRAVHSAVMIKKTNYLRMAALAVILHALGPHLKDASDGGFECKSFAAVSSMQSARWPRSLCCCLELRFRHSRSTGLLHRPPRPCHLRLRS